MKKAVAPTTIPIITGVVIPLLFSGVVVLAIRGANVLEYTGSGGKVVGLGVTGAAVTAGVGVEVGVSDGANVAFVSTALMILYVTLKALLAFAAMTTNCAASEALLGVAGSEEPK